MKAIGLNLSLTFAVALIIVLFTLADISAASSTVDPALRREVRDKLGKAFEAVAEAERMGGNVSGLVDELNQALALIEEAEVRGDGSLLQGALVKVEYVIARAPVVGESGTAAAQARMVQSILAIGAATFLGVVVWRYQPRVFWRLWVWSKRRWRVDPRG